MKPKFISNGYLRAAAGETEGGGGSAVVDPAKSAEEQKGESIKEPNMIEKFTASFKDKATLVSERNEAQGLLATAQARITELEGENQTLREQVTGFETDMATLNAAFEAEQKQTKIVDLAAAKKITTLGFEENKLPAQKQAATETKETLQAQLDAEQDAGKRYELQDKIDALDA